MTATIIHGDAFAVLGSLADASVDHVITDPPYTARSSRGARTNKRSAAPTGAGGATDMAAHVGAWDEKILARFAAECLRVSRRWVIIFCELESLGTFAALPGYVRAGIWDRHSTPQITGDRPAQPAEGLAFLHARAEDAPPDAYDHTDEHPGAMAIAHRDGRKRWNGGGKRGIWRHPIARGAARSPHPAQKPDGLILDLIQDFTDPGDSILDPCCGVGTVPGVAAGVGRIGVGVESSRVWYARAVLRMAEDPAWLAPLTDAEREELAR